MPFSRFSVGRDISVRFTNPLTGGPINWGGLVTDFTSKPMNKDIKSEPLGEAPIFADPADGWEGSFTVDRADSSVDDFFDALEANYWNGSVIPNGTISLFETNIDGTTTRRQFVSVSLRLTDAGNLKAADKVTYKIAFKASRRIKLQ